MQSTIVAKKIANLIKGEKKESQHFYYEGDTKLDLLLEDNTSYLIEANKNHRQETNREKISKARFYTVT